MSRTSDLARELSDGCITYKDAREANPAGADEQLERLRALTMRAVARAREVGWGTVDHIVLASVLGLIQREVPEIGALLEASGWAWPQ